MKTETKDIILAMSKEFDEKEGYITCEISIHKDKIPQLEEFLKDKPDMKFGKWIAIECDTCVGYHGEGYLHLSIERFDVVEKIEESSNFIKTF